MLSATNGSAPKVARRTVLKAGAWSVPVITTAAMLPLAAASTVCVDGQIVTTALNWSSVGDLASNWPNQTTTGWVGGFSGAPGGDASQNITGVANGFVSQDDNDSTTEVATITTSVTLPVVDGAQYSLSPATFTGFGNPGSWDGSARQSVIVDVQQPDASSSELLKLSAWHWDAPTITPTDAQMRADGFVLQDPGTTQDRPLMFTASGTGTATLRFTFTIQPKIGTNRSDDIGVSIPQVVTQVCSV